MESIKNIGRPVYIVAAKRTPIGSFMGKLSKLTGPELGGFAIKAALQQIKLNPKDVDEVILGNVVSAGQGQAPARQAALKGGLLKTTPCTTVNKVCSSGMKSIMFGAQSIALGQSECVVAGGFESMSNAPFYVSGHRKGHMFGDQKLTDSLTRDGLSDAYSNMAMGTCAEKTASDFSMTRQEQDQYAISSYERVIESTKLGRFKNEIVPIPIENGQLAEDEESKRYNRSKMLGLKPVFKENGTITAGNSSKINDGACAISKPIIVDE